MIATVFLLGMNVLALLWGGNHWWASRQYLACYKEANAGWGRALDEWEKATALNVRLADELAKLAATAAPFAAYPDEP